MLKLKETGYIKTLPDETLPAQGNVVINIRFSTLSFKDALAITHTGPIVRHWPMVPSIDLAGMVTHSSHPHFVKDDQVVLNGWGIGESHWGGLAQKAKVNGDWLIHLSAGITLKQAMAIGMAGYTAMLCIIGLGKHGITPTQGDILVTGASGGVGSIAIAILAKLGYRVIASTGKLSETAYLTSFGAAEVIERSHLSTAGKPINKVEQHNRI